MIISTEVAAHLCGAAPKATQTTREAKSKPMLHIKYCVEIHRGSFVHILHDTIGLREVTVIEKLLLLFLFQIGNSFANEKL